MCACVCVRNASLVELVCSKATRKLERPPALNAPPCSARCRGIVVRQWGFRIPFSNRLHPHSVVATHSARLPVYPPLFDPHASPLPASLGVSFAPHFLEAPGCGTLPLISSTNKPQPGSAWQQGQRKERGRGVGTRGAWGAWVATKSFGGLRLANRPCWESAFSLPLAATRQARSLSLTHSHSWACVRVCVCACVCVRSCLSVGTHTHTGSVYGREEASVSSAAPAT